MGRRAEEDHIIGEEEMSDKDSSLAKEQTTNRRVQRDRHQAPEDSESQSPIATTKDDEALVLKTSIDATDEAIDPPTARMNASKLRNRRSAFVRRSERNSYRPGCYADAQYYEESSQEPAATQALEEAEDETPSTFLRRSRRNIYRPGSYAIAPHVEESSEEPAATTQLTRRASRAARGQVRNNANSATDRSDDTEHQTRKPRARWLVPEDSSDSSGDDHQAPATIDRSASRSRMASTASEDGSTAASHVAEHSCTPYPELDGVKDESAPIKREGQESDNSS